MRLTRRSLLGGAAAIGAAPALAQTGLAAGPAVTVIDSRLPEARAHALRGKVIDIADAGADLWKLAHNDLANAATITGLTGWSDWVVLRGLLAEQGKRVTAETRLPHAGLRVATPFAWEMA